MQLINNLLENNLSTTAFYIILNCLEEPKTMTDLARGSHSQTASMTGMVDRMTDRGLVNRVLCSGDRRLTYVKTSPEGARLLVTVTENGKLIEEKEEVA